MNVIVENPQYVNHTRDLKRKFEKDQAAIDSRMDKKVKLHHAFGGIDDTSGDPEDIEDLDIYYKELELGTKRSSNLQKLNKFFHNSQKNIYNFQYHKEIDKTVEGFCTK